MIAYLTEPASEPLDPGSWLATQVQDVRLLGVVIRRELTQAARCNLYEANVLAHGRTRLAFEAVAARGADGLPLELRVSEYVHALNDAHYSAIHELKLDGLLEVVETVGGGRAARLTSLGLERLERYQGAIELLERAANPARTIRRSSCALARRLRPG